VTAAKFGVAVAVGVGGMGEMVGVAVSGTAVEVIVGALRVSPAIAWAVRRTSSLESVGVPLAPRQPVNRLRNTTAPVHFVL
jgi:hypothetical protein